MHRQLNLNSRTDQLKKERNFHRFCQLEKALAFLCAAHLVSITVGVIPSFSIASAQIVQFDDPILTVSTDAGRKNLTETYIRIAIVDPGKPINGVYINTNATNPTLDFKVGEIVEVSGIAPEYFSGLMLKVLLVNGNVIKIPPSREFLDINFTGEQKVLFSIMILKRIVISNYNLVSTQKANKRTKLTSKTP